jgi:hypothetical protein
MGADLQSFARHAIDGTAIIDGLGMENLSNLTSYTLDGRVCTEHSKRCLSGQHEIAMLLTLIIQIHYNGPGKSPPASISPGF